MKSLGPQAEAELLQIYSDNKEVADFLRSVSVEDEEPEITDLDFDQKT